MSVCVWGGCECMCGTVLRGRLCVCMGGLCVGGHRTSLFLVTVCLHHLHLLSRLFSVDPLLGVLSLCLAS